MRATDVLQKRLGDALTTMCAKRQRILLDAVESLIQGGRLTLMDLAHLWPGAERNRAALKALDRLLSNRHLHAERETKGSIFGLCRCRSALLAAVND